MRMKQGENLQFIQLRLVHDGVIGDRSLKEIPSKAKLLQTVHAADLWKWIWSWKLIATQIPVTTFQSNQQFHMSTSSLTQGSKPALEKLYVRSN